MARSALALLGGLTLVGAAVPVDVARDAALEIIAAR
jgi:hypothetical protein